MDKGRWIVVTGASSGVGAKTAETLLSSGYQVVVTARNGPELQALYGENQSVEIIPWDLSEPDEIRDYAKAVKEAVGPVHGLVHCAGIDKRAPVYMIKVDKIDEVFRINTYASILLVSAFSRKGVTADGASFVLISSLSAHEGAMGNSVYAASKAAVEGFVKSVAPELTEKGARINCIAPGVIETRMTTEYLNLLTEEQRDAHVGGYPLGIGKPSDIADFAEYLVSDKARWLTGQTYILDGGRLARK
jgi:NAD(P)-dependent dehydrogenase (short-subunit alcohol dehydrogenase family)